MPHRAHRYQGVRLNPIIGGMRAMASAARKTARAADILSRMLGDQDCTNILHVGAAPVPAGVCRICIDMVRHNMVNAIVATGAAVVDMDFFEAPGFRRYRGSPVADDKRLRELYIDRIYDTYIDEEQMFFAETTSALPLIAGYAYRKRL